ncbi:hypothetical protein SD71_16145 [Cohnella kolymensis]|uniref:DUF4352 domain-containing protein n=1 Tax=Cohnella kolymensis TaxID=1590652 RepID=A0ABR5A262_9BACL|nr:hypothetical protein [Cohnella kolymensis]KIL35156.1 hypothetical protein SD71_16145 [Cohnella kolymensis]
MLAKILKDYEGIIGAVLGVAVTMIVTFILKKIGKVYITVDDFDIKNYRFDSGYPKGTVDYAEAEYVDISFEISFFNSSDEPRGFQDIKVVFYDSYRNVIFKKTPHDMRTTRNTSYGSTSDELKIINLPSKTMLQIGVETYVREELVKEMSKCASIYFESKDHKGRVTKHLLKKNMIVKNPQ